MNDGCKCCTQNKGKYTRLWAVRNKAAEMQITDCPVICTT